MGSTRHTLERIELPADFAEAFEHIAGTAAAPATLGECIAAFNRMMEAAEVTISVEQMYQPEPTSHAVHLGQRVEYVPCVLDALLVALLVEADPARIESESPDGDATVSLRVSKDSIEVSPGTAVFSLGLAFADAGESPTEALGKTDTALSMASCEYINAFVDETAYDQWQGQLSDAVVLQLSANEMQALATQIATGSVVTEEP